MPRVVIEGCDACLKVFERVMGGAYRIFAFMCAANRGRRFF